jgi:hypothetical protein
LDLASRRQDLELGKALVELVELVWLLVQQVALVEVLVELGAKLALEKEG